MPNATFKVTAQSENPTKTKVKARNFELIIDEPANLGGTNEGANPVEFVTAALAGCLNVAGNMIAKEMGFEIRDLSFEIEGDLDPAAFMGKTDKVRPGYKEIRVNVKMDTDADAETLKKWLQKVESRCPVSDNLANETPVKFNLQ